MWLRLRGGEEADRQVAAQGNGGQSGGGGGGGGREGGTVTFAAFDF